MEKTFVMLKPDAIQRNLVGEIVGRLEKKGLQLVGMKMLRMDTAMASKHYAEHVGKAFFDGLIEFITSGPVLAMVWSGQNAIQVVRQSMGVTDPQEASPGTIRGDLGLFKGNNLVHGSDSPASAEREIALFFEKQELLSYEKELDPWVYG